MYLGKWARKPVFRFSVFEKTGTGCLVIVQNPVFGFFLSNTGFCSKPGFRFLIKHRFLFKHRFSVFDQTPVFDHFLSNTGFCSKPGFRFLIKPWFLFKTWFSVFHQTLDFGQTPVFVLFIKRLFMFNPLFFFRKPADWSNIGFERNHLKVEFEQEYQTPGTYCMKALHSSLCNL
jgi:hypothetical protein